MTQLNQTVRPTCRQGLVLICVLGCLAIVAALVATAPLTLTALASISSRACSRERAMLRRTNSASRRRLATTEVRPWCGDR